MLVIDRGLVIKYDAHALENPVAVVFARAVTGGTTGVPVAGEHHYINNNDLTF